MAVVGFTDESLKLFDLRARPENNYDDFSIDLEGGHSDIVKAVKLNPEGLLCISASMDGTLRLWDIGMKKCIKVFGELR